MKRILAFVYFCLIAAAGDASAAAPMLKVTSMCTTTTMTMALAPQWWMPRITGPNGTSVIRYSTLS